MVRVYGLWAMEVEDGDVRSDLGTRSQTDYGYTGPREIEGSELMDYKARFMSPGLGRFTQPDTIIPDTANPQNLNRYTYTLNNPVKYTDPSGHIYLDETEPDETPNVYTDVETEDGVIVYDSEKEAIEKDAEELAKALADAYNAAAEEINQNFIDQYGDILEGEEIEDSLVPLYDPEELWYELFGGPVVFIFKDSPCDGIYTAKLNRDIGGVNVGNNIGKNDFGEHPGFAIHEITHVLDLYLPDTEGYFSGSISGKGLGRDQGGWGGVYPDVQYSPSDFTAEVFADMMAHWASSGIEFSSNTMGRRRQSHMDQNMGYLLVSFLN